MKQSLHTPYGSIESDRASKEPLGNLTLSCPVIFLPFTITFI